MGCSSIPTVSLLDMVPFYAGLLYAIGIEAKRFEDSLLYQEEKRGADADIVSGEAETARQLIKHLIVQCERVDLKRALERLHDLAGVAHKLESVSTLRSLGMEFVEIRKAICKDLAERLFLYVPLEASKYHEEGKHRHELLKSDTASIFPEANKELIAAGNCYATDNHTASVFHLMRAVEHGVRTVFKTLRIKFPINPRHPTRRKPIEERQWGEINTAIEEEIKRLEKRKKTRKRDEKIEFLRGFNTQFKYYKIKWRNNVMHTKESYDEPDARETMRHVRDFIEHIAAYLHE